LGAELKRVAVLGSTGSIGIQALEVISESPQLVLHSILCNSRTDILDRQIEEYEPSSAYVIESPKDYSGSALSGRDVFQRAIDGADLVLNAIVGSAGLRASLLTAQNGLTLALANKESLVVGGELLREFIASGRVIPVDSEHSTIFRCLAGEHNASGIILTASGGSLRDCPLENIGSATPSEVLNHPTWEMGARITVDSASMVNKAFEIIEAGWLFPGIPIDVVMHPQSIVHSFVLLEDGSWKALMGQPDMRIPIQYALKWPESDLSRISNDSPLDWKELTFKALESRRYPAFGSVVQASKDGGTSPAVANASDEIAVKAFLEGRIDFGTIASVIEAVLAKHDRGPISCFEDVLEADRWAREAAEEVVRSAC